MCLSLVDKEYWGASSAVNAHEGDEADEHPQPCASFVEDGDQVVPLQNNHAKRGALHEQSHGKA